MAAPIRRPSNVEDLMMSRNGKAQGRATRIAAFVGWGVLLWVAFCVAPYLYAVNDLIQWR
jgi:hypothetical protein